MMMHLLRIRLGFFRNQTKGLYNRYIDVCFLLALLFAPALIQTPALVAYPILAFFEHPLDIARNLVPLLTWMGLSIVWATMHRPFIQGGQLAQFVRSLSISEGALRLADIAMLVAGMAIFAVPVAVAIWTALQAEQSAGADGRFWFYLPLLAMLTLSLAREAVYGAAPRVRQIQLLTLFVLLSPPALAAVVRHELVLCLLSAALAASLFRARKKPGTVGSPFLHWLEKLGGYPPLVFLLTNFRRFLHTQWHDSVSRILWSIMPLAFSWWMIHVVGKQGDAPMFVHFALGCFIGILSGSYRALLGGRLLLTTYARSIGHGVRALALADHVLMVTLAASILVPWLLLFALNTDLFSGLYLVKLFVFYTTLLVLLGMPWVQLHQRTVFVKFAIATLGMLIAGTLL